MLGGLQGLIFIDKDYYNQHANDKPGKVLLSYIKLVGDIAKPATQDIFAYSAPKITVPPNQSYISLKFACPLSFTHAEGFMRIRGISDAWQSFNFGEEVNLVDLPPGTYTLEARLGESLEQQYWFTKTLIVLPAFYQTFWFKALLLFAFMLLTASIVYYFWRSNIRKLRAEQQLRTTIASDLHDDIGSTLNSISVYTEIAGQQLYTDAEKAKILLDKMGAASRSMIDTMSDIVWTVNPKNDDFENVLKRMQFFAGELLSGKNILLNFEVDERVKKLKFTMQERKNIYLIFKEAVNNIYKYAEATAVTITITKDGNYLALGILDNGRGFNTSEKNSSGNGLMNMKNRAAEIGGKLTIDSSLSSGTLVYLRLRLV
jgi:signal transduction histidine kinase